MQPAAATTPERDVSFSALFQSTWDVVRAHPIPLLLLPVLLGILSGSGNSGSRYTMAKPPTNPLVLIPFFAIFGILALVVLALVVLASAYVALVTTRAALDAIQTRREPDLGAAMRGVRDHYWPALGTFLLWVLVVAIGLVLIVVPGLIALAGFFPIAAVVVAEGKTGTDALKRAWELANGHKWAIFGLGLVVLIVSGIVGSIFGFIPLIGGAISGIVSGACNGFLLVAGALFYSRQSAPMAPPPAPAASAAPPAW